MICKRWFHVILLKLQRWKTKQCPQKRRPNTPQGTFKCGIIPLIRPDEASHLSSKVTKLQTGKSKETWKYQNASGIWSRTWRRDGWIYLLNWRTDFYKQEQGSSNINTGFSSLKLFGFILTHVLIKHWVAICLKFKGCPTWRAAPRQKHVCCHISYLKPSSLCRVCIFSHNRRPVCCFLCFFPEWHDSFCTERTTTSTL